MSLQSDTSGALAPLPAGVALPPRLLDHLLEALCGVLLLGSVLVATTQVTLRYGFHSGIPWAEEVAVWAFAWAVFLGMGMATWRESHIAIDTVPNLLPPRYRAWLVFFNRAVIAAASIMLIVPSRRRRRCSGR